MRYRYTELAPDNNWAPPRSFRRWFSGFVTSYRNRNTQIKQTLDALLCFFGEIRVAVAEN